MLFNSYIFLLVFLPIVLLVYLKLILRGNIRRSVAWLLFSSFVFYAWWNPYYLFLLIFSITINFFFGLCIADNSHIYKKRYLQFGILFNLCLLGYFKYGNFFIQTLGQISGISQNLQEILLPLGISFFTFQQIAYLIDVSRTNRAENNPLNYAVFVSFFPQLIAGPIVHYKEIIPQLTNPMLGKDVMNNLAIGLSIFGIGLFKKVVLADGLSVYSSPVFEAAKLGTQLSFFEAWGGVLAYSFQLYFDFSGYSDMAIGIARMFGIILPLNFLSPYKSCNIIEFWRKWHITLSGFLRDYLYIPLGGSKNGEVRRYLSLTVTMLLGGLWHGAGLTFLVWGGLHGFYLIINHTWRSLVVKNLKISSKGNLFTKGFSIGVTFFFVTIAWVVFRSDDFGTALTIYGSMFGGNGISLPSTLVHLASGELISALEYTGLRFDGMFENGIVAWEYGVLLYLLAIIIVFFIPNTAEIFSGNMPDLMFPKQTRLNYDGRFIWSPSIITIMCALIIWIIVIEQIRFNTSEFLYYQF